MAPSEPSVGVIAGAAGGAAAALLLVGVVAFLVCRNKKRKSGAASTAAAAAAVSGNESQYEMIPKSVSDDYVVGNVGLTPTSVYGVVNPQEPRYADPDVLRDTRGVGTEYSNL